MYCRRRRRYEAKPWWYIETVADLPKVGERISDWETRRKAQRVRQQRVNILGLHIVETASEPLEALLNRALGL
jgi:hypothetical protein